MKKSLFSALFLSFAINASEYIKDSKKATKQRARILAQISPITNSTQYKEYCTQYRKEYRKARGGCYSAL